MDRFKRPLIYLMLVILIGLTIYYSTACGSSTDGASQTSSGSGKDMTEFTTETLAGEQVDQSIFGDNDVTMVNFWATFCTPCIEEMPDLGEIYREKEGSGFSIVGVVMDVQNSDFSVIDSKVEEADTIVADTNADYQHLLLSESINTDMIEAYKITSIPTTFFVDSKGKVIDGPYVGSRSKSDWEKIIGDVTQ